MKDLLNKTSTTSIIAVLIVTIGFLLLFCLSFVPTHIDAALKTQIVQGDWNIMSIAALYYFGTSKARTSAQPGSTNLDLSLNTSPPKDDSQ